MIHKFQDTERQCFTIEQYNILNHLITLWTHYQMWTRSLFIAKEENLQNLSAVQDRVYEIPMDFYNTMRVFYGDRLAQQFSNAIQRYIIIQINLMDAMLANDPDAANTYTQQLYESADEIATLLSQTPYWDLEQWKSLLYQDISLTIEDFRARLTGDYEREISIYERMLLNAT
ncbi:MAG TPA: hypothetical protein VM577_02995, partial [Anaerovoracaceae bacterium]|nr:hypothetical protein [Anaerovoracaceae bacterium]